MVVLGRASEYNGEPVAWLIAATHGKVQVCGLVYRRRLATGTGHASFGQVSGDLVGAGPAA